MERSVGEHTTESSQPHWKGAMRGKITAAEEAYEGFRDRMLYQQRRSENVGLIMKGHF